VRQQFEFLPHGVVFFKMKIIIKTTGFELTPSIKNYINEKIGSIAKFLPDLFNKEYYDGYFGKGKPKVEAWVEVGKTTKHHRKGKVFFAECQMNLPGGTVRVEATSNDLKQAIVEVKDKLQREVKQYKEKIRDEFKRGDRAVKKELKISSQAKLKKKAE